MRNFKATEWIRIPGGGWLILVDIPEKDPLPFIDEQVLIDSSSFHVCGLEYNVISEEPFTHERTVGIKINRKPYRSERDGIKIKKNFKKTL